MLSVRGHVGISKWRQTYFDKDGKRNGCAALPEPCPTCHQVAGMKPRTAVKAGAMPSAPPRKRIRRRRTRHWAHIPPGSALERRLRKLLCPTAESIVTALVRPETPQPSPKREAAPDVPPLQLSQISDAVDILLRASQSQEAASDAPS